MFMKKNGKVEIGKTPCIICGEVSVIVHNGNAYCTIHGIPKKKEKNK